MIQVNMNIHVLSRNSVFQQILILTSIYINSFLLGCVYGWMSIAVYFFNEGTEISVSATECGWIAAMAEIGKILTAFPAGILVDKYGKKKIMLAIGFLEFPAWLLLSLSRSVLPMYIARFMLGICLGLKLTTGVSHIGEIASPNKRGIFSGAYQAASSAGIAFPPLLGAVTKSYKVSVWGPTVVAIIYVVALYWTSESPNYYIARGEYDMAKRVLYHIRMSSPQPEIDSEYESLKFYIENEKRNKKELSWLQFLRSKPIRKSIVTGALLGFFTTLTGLYAISAFMANIIPKNRYISEKYYPSISLLLSTICNLCSAFVIEKLPRRTIYFIACSIGSLTQVLNGSALYLYNCYHQECFFWLFIIGYIYLRVIWGVMIFPLQQTVKSEIFPQAVKGIANSVVIVSTSLAILISYQLYQFTNKYLGLHCLFGSFAISFICLATVVYFRLPEGKGKRIADLQIESRNVNSVV